LKLKSLPNVSSALIVDLDECLTCNAVPDHDSEEKPPVQEQLPQKIGAQNETIVHWLAGHPNNSPDVCMICTLMKFSAKDAVGMNNNDTPTVDHAKSIPSSLSDMSVASFLSLPCMSHTIEDSAAGKSIVNLSGHSEDILVSGVHCSLDHLCGRFCSPSVRDAAFPFRVHHCSSLGAKEQLSNRWSQQLLVEVVSSLCGVSR